MKKILILLILLQMTSIINAQKNQFGFKAGINFASLSSNDNSQQKSLQSQIGFNAGVLVEIPISEKFAVQPELFYSRQGASFGSLNGGYGQTFNNTSSSFVLNYFNLPVILKYKVDKNTYLEFGPQLGFLVSASLDSDSYKSSASQTVSKLFNDIDFGLNIGIGIPIAKDLILNGRYSLGLTNIWKNADANDNFTLKNRVISAGLIFIVPQK